MKRIALMAAVATLTVVACGSTKSQSQHDQAAGYISKHGADATAVRLDVVEVQATIAAYISGPSTTAVDYLATVAQQAHDDLANGKDGFADTSGSGSVGNATTWMYTAVDDLKNSMGAIVAFTGAPNPATQAKMTTQYATAIGEWNAAVSAIWTAAGVDGVPTIS